MTQQASFTPSEWALLGDAPLAASAAVALASYDGGAQESLAIVAGWREAGRLFATSELIQAIVVQLDPELRETQERKTNPAASAAPPTGGAILQEAVELCARAVRLLDEKATPQETEDYKRFVLEIASTVADAASEGPFGFGLGSHRTSSAERYVLQQVAGALGL
jgi:hypothetical protein